MPHIPHRIFNSPMARSARVLSSRSREDQGVRDRPEPIVERRNGRAECTASRMNSWCVTSRAAQHDCYAVIIARRAPIVSSAQRQATYRSVGFSPGDRTHSLKLARPVSKYRSKGYARIRRRNLELFYMRDTPFLRPSSDRSMLAQTGSFTSASTGARGCEALRRRPSIPTSSMPTSSTRTWRRELWWCAIADRRPSAQGRCNDPAL